MLTKGTEVWVQGYVIQNRERISASTSGILLEDVIERSRTVLVQLAKFNGDENVTVKVQLRFIHEL